MYPNCADLAGTYRGDDSVFVMRPDGTYQQRFTSACGTFPNTGTWSVDYDIDMQIDSVLVSNESQWHKPDVEPVSWGNFNLTDRTCTIYPYMGHCDVLTRTSLRTGTLHGVPEPLRD